jgi:hypothetical protein
MENELKKLSEENKKLEYKSGKLKMCEQLALRVKNMKLNLIVPDKGKDIILVKRLREHTDKNPHGKS